VIAIPRNPQKWLDLVKAPVFFSRVTQISLLRLLTNRRAMGQDVLYSAQAIDIYRALLADERISFAAEPDEIGELWPSLMSAPVSFGATWTDARLAAFAVCGKLRLVSFDSGMQRLPRLN
jgi:predicted nucleic acid-binding protein